MVLARQLHPVAVGRLTAGCRAPAGHEQALVTIPKSAVTHGGGKARIMAGASGRVRSAQPAAVNGDPGSIYVAAGYQIVPPARDRDLDIDTGRKLVLVQDRFRPWRVHQKNG